MLESSPLTLSFIFKSAFNLTKKNFLAYLPILVLILLAFNFFSMQYLSDINFEDPDLLLHLQDKTYLITVITLLATPIEIGLMLMGVRAARGFTIKSTNLMAIFPDSARIVILALFAFVAVQIGMALFIIPGLFILMMTSMAQPLMCDFRLSMIEAVRRSFKVCYSNLGLVINFYIILFAIIVASFFTFGIALIVTIPFYLNAKGVLYCQLFDKKSEEDDIESLLS